jgi:hypothetical protein
MLQRRFIATPMDRPVRPKRQKLPKQRGRVLAFIQSEVAKGRPFPSKRAIRDHMGWSQMTSAADVLNSLVMDGWLRRIGRDEEGRRSLIWELVE